MQLLFRRKLMRTPLVRQQLLSRFGLRHRFSSEHCLQLWRPLKVVAFAMELGVGVDIKHQQKEINYADFTMACRHSNSANHPNFTFAIRTKKSRLTGGISYFIG